jgi:RNA polymerase sigma-70 factor (ECF subfamily)
MKDNLLICSYRDYLINHLSKKFPRARKEDIEDAVQDAIVKAIRHQDKWLGNSSLRTWLSKIAINMYFNTFRLPYVKHEDTVSSKEMFFIFDGTTNDFSDEFCSNEFSNDLSEFLFNDLDKDISLQTFLLFYKDDLDYNQITEIQNIPIGTVKSRIFKARKKLQIKYEAYKSEQQ